MNIVDTDVLIQFLRGNASALDFIKKMLEQEGIIRTTIYNVGELYKGIYESTNPAKTEREVNDLIDDCEIVYPNLESQKIWAQITTELKKNYGKQFMKDIGDIDQLIASIVLSRKERLITRNIKHYNKIRGLEIENWEKKK
jgi:tRNA(fMet)-specific endonuclease VapC